MIKIDYACTTHTGLVREQNEDAYFADANLGLWIVADGMGGHQAGDVASHLVVQELPTSIQNGDSLEEAIEVVHMMVQMASEQVEGHRHMGSTVVVAQIKQNHYRIAWVGDSRAYLWRDYKLSQLTKDHSYVQMLLDMGMISEDEVRTHPSRNVIVQGLGVGGLNGNAIEVDIVEGELAAGDTILLCSDGLYGEVRDEEIANVLITFLDNKSRLEQLLQFALMRGGADNITAILLTAEES